MSEADEIAGSQTGSQRWQTPGGTRPRPATVGAARRHIRPHTAPVSDARGMPPKREAAPFESRLGAVSVAPHWRAFETAGPDTGCVMGEGTDFFVSHAGADRAWAEWVAWQLTEAGYTVELDLWDWAAGQNFVTAMSDALARCDRMVALLSAAYFERSRYTTEEWTAMV